MNNYNPKSETFLFLNKHSWWVQNACLEYSGAKNILNELDEIAYLIETNINNKSEILKKVNSIYNSDKDFADKSINSLDSKERESERKLFSFFSELMVYKELFLNNYSNILLVPLSTIKTVDISAEKNGKQYYIEVKRIQSPRDEAEELCEKSSFSKFINLNFKNPLKKKMLDFIKGANEKFNNLDNFSNLSKEEKILFIDFEAGIDSGLTFGFKSTLEDIFGNEICNLDKNLTIKTRKYF